MGSWLGLLCFFLEPRCAYFFTQRDDQMIPPLLTLSNRVFFSLGGGVFFEHRDDRIHTADQGRMVVDEISSSVTKHGFFNHTTHDHEDFFVVKRL